MVIIDKDGYTYSKTPHHFPTYEEAKAKAAELRFYGYKAMVVSDGDEYTIYAV